MNPDKNSTCPQRRSLLQILALLPVIGYVNPILASGDLSECEWCGANEAPSHLSSHMRIAAENEIGERLRITGCIVDRSGKPAAGVLLYAYHTNHTGLYEQKGNETGNGKRHGYLRGWLRTGADGCYRIDTVRPASYPGRKDPAHIHATLTPPGTAEYYIDNFLFEGDPKISDAIRERAKITGDQNILILIQDEQGVWHGQRNLRLR